ncbi:MAG: hypothetical protein AB7U29_19400 [Desulfobulbus sp.]|nr:hypothetical protein [Desulfobulbus sp.]
MLSYSPIYILSFFLSFWMFITVSFHLFSIGLKDFCDNSLLFAEYRGFSQGYSLGFLTLALPIILVSACHSIEWFFIDDNFSRFVRMFRREK